MGTYFFRSYAIQLHTENISYTFEEGKEGG
jgi:hypothetical protein